MPDNPIVNEYLKKTGQTEQKLLSGNQDCSYPTPLDGDQTGAFESL